MTKDEDDHARRRGGRQDSRVPKHGQIQNPSVLTFYCYTDLTVALTLAPSDHHSGLSLIYMARVPCRSVHHSYPPQNSAKRAMPARDADQQDNPRWPKESEGRSNTL